ncbi:protein kinase [Micromonospora krabiensis]|uniref:non-specific serine/threonine protein kinase n=1 Tax=Micromonospora krabiensis TaxID=307121 RepID=A0A1C3N1H4_9ACTN|nr:serine/threonine-protein kinase [Micromonospora krabiensis]SBV26430.1 serine/threonine protein kinase [Micromonospora krabiensis]
MSPLTPTLRLHDRYVLRERIGLGGMSEVWRADDEVLGRPVAVKALAGEFAVDPHLRATIQREARAAARLTHPHITRVYDYREATLDSGTVVPYLVMELVEGHSLADRLADGPLAWPEAVRVAAQVAAALAAAHRIGVVHRDVKPGNVMITESGAKVLDFGIAALAGPHHPVAGQTGELLMGTPAYFAPERLAPGPPDPASDVYALGALLYRTLTGHGPLPVQTWEDALEVHQRRTPVPPLRVPGLPFDVAEMTLAALRADPARRPTAAQLATRLAAAQPVDLPAAILPTATAGPPLPPTSPAHPLAPTSPAHPLAPTSPAGPPLAPTGHLIAPTSPAGAPLAPTSPAGSGAAAPSAGRPTRSTWPAGRATVPPAHPPTLIDRAPVASRPADAARRPARRSRGPVAALVAVGLVLLLGLGTLVVLGDRDPVNPPAAAPDSSATEAPPSPETPDTAPPSRPEPSPSTPGPATVSLRQLGAEFAAILAQAQLRGEVDRRTAEDLREELADLGRGKPKDREKRIEDLRERISRAVERDGLSARTAAQLDTLLTHLDSLTTRDG